MWQLHTYYAAPVFEYHDVRFLRQNDSTGYAWDMEKPDGKFRAEFCRDYPVPDLHPQPGDVMWKFRYQDAGCWSIKRSDLGFWFYTDNSKTVSTDINKDFQLALKEIKHEQRER